MKPEFSEFSYGFAVTSELDQWLGNDLIAAPVFPSLRQERDLGWDVNLRMAGVSVFLQFKLADLLTKPTASEWRFYGAPYYRFQLHRALRSRQHNLLKRLAEANRYVHYVAPRFTRVPEFDFYYRQSRVVSESAWVAIARLPWVSDAYQHHITYRTGRDLRFSSPESEPLDQDLSGESWINQLISSWETEHSLPDRAYFERVRAMLVKVLSESPWNLSWQVNWPAAMESGHHVLKEITYLCRTFFGVEMVLIGRRLP
jgi:hypothetical protein